MKKENITQCYAFDAAIEKYNKLKAIIIHFR
jgi:hypothetical protein